MLEMLSESLHFWMSNMLNVNTIFRKMRSRQGRWMTLDEAKTKSGLRLGKEAG